MRSLVVIPARMASTRFPGKPLVDLCGKPMIQWVVERVREVTDHVVVATPDEAIIEACRRIDVDARFTREDHPSGTDRVAEIAASMPADFYINVQGDEPLIRPATIRACIEALDAGEAPMSSVYCRCPEDEIEQPAVVKVVMDQRQRALYFSRYPIPYPRQERTAPVYKHIGIYGFSGELLARYATWPQTPLERAESLEQLRFLENGTTIRMAYGEGSELAVDTPEQAEAVRRILSTAERP